VEGNWNRPPTNFGLKVALSHTTLITWSCLLILIHCSQSALWSTNTEEIDRILRRHVRYFDGVFSIDTLPDRPHLLVCSIWCKLHYVSIFRSFVWSNFNRNPMTM